MDIVTMLSFLGTAVLLTLMPGPDNMFVLAQSISQNKKAGIATSLGLCTGLLVHITAATAGISALIYQSALAFSIIKYLGAIYLLYLAYKSFRSKDDAAAIGNNETRHYAVLYRKGVIMNVLNPKVSLFFLALLPQFVHQKATFSVSVQMLIYGLIFLTQALILFTFISFFAEKAGHLLRKNPRISGKMNMFQGIIFTLIGLKIALSER